MINVIDIGICNLGSLFLALRKIGVESMPTRSPTDLEQASMVILPGVGAFGEGMARLREFGLVEPIGRRVLEDSLPMIGICLGMQLLFERSDEYGSHTGLGVLKGEVRRLPLATAPYRIPNIGWCDVTVSSKDGSVAGDTDPSAFYFSHSHRVVPVDPAIIAGTFQFGDHSIPAVISKGMLRGIQFHPEISQGVGLTMLQNLITDLAVRASEAKNEARP
jgi:glutamine amidotransferase